MNQKITFLELIDLLAQRQNISKREAEAFLREMTSLMSETISSGESLRINGLGVFKPTWVEARSSVNVQTGEPYIIPGHYKLSFAPVKTVRDIINEPFACFSAEILPDEATVDDCQPSDDESEAEDIEIVEENIIEQSHSQDDRPNIAPSVVDADVPMADNMASAVEEKKVEDDAHQAEEPVIVNTTHKEVENIEHVKEKEDMSAAQKTEPVNMIDDEKLAAMLKREFRQGLLSGIFITATIFIVLLLSYYMYSVECKESDMGASDSLESEYSAPTINEENTASVDIYADEPEIQQPVVEQLSTEYKQVVDTVKKGVYLTTLSLKHYGHKAFWVYIYEENRDIIDDFDNIPVGTEIVIPPAYKYAIDADDSLAIEQALDLAETLKSQRKQSNR